MLACLYNRESCLLFLSLLVYLLVSCFVMGAFPSAEALWTLGRASFLRGAFMLYVYYIDLLLVVCAFFAACFSGTCSGSLGWYETVFFWLLVSIFNLTSRTSLDVISNRASTLSRIICDCWIRLANSFSSFSFWLWMLGFLTGAFPRD